MSAAPEIATRMRITRHTMENYLHQIYNLLEIDLELVNAPVTAANWYGSRRGMIKHQYFVEVDDLPVIIEVRWEPGGG